MYHAYWSICFLKSKNWTRASSFFSSQFEIIKLDARVQFLIRHSIRKSGRARPVKQKELAGPAHFVKGGRILKILF